MFFANLKLILGLLPLLVQAITAIESAFPIPNAGVVKLDAVKTILQTSYSASTDIEGSFEKIWTMVQPIVNALVTLMNRNKN